MSRIAFLSAFLLASSILAAPPYPYRENRLPTVRLERHEWANIVAIGRTEIGDEPLKAAFRAALGDERANRYIEDQEGEPFTKQDTHALVRELYPLIPGAVEPNPPLATREDKTDWIIAQARRCFVNVEGGVAVPDDARIAEVIHYALDRVEEFELAGGTLEKFPDPPPVPESDIPEGTTWLHHDVSSWPVTATLDASISGDKLILSYDKAKTWPATATTAGDGLNANPWVFVELDGRWYAATFEWLRFGQTSKPLYTVAGDHVKVSPLSGDWRPSPGQRMGVMVSGLARAASRNVRERSNISWITYP